MTPHAVSLLDATDRLDAVLRMSHWEQDWLEMFDRLMQVMASALGADLALVSLVDVEEQIVLGAAGLRAPWAQRRVLPVEYSFCQHVVVRREMLVIADATRRPTVGDSKGSSALGVHSYIGAPLFASGGHVVGVVGVGMSQPRLWRKDDLALVKDVTQIVQHEFATYEKLLGLQSHLRVIEHTLQEGYEDEGGSRSPAQVLWFPGSIFDAPLQLMASV